MLQLGEIKAETEALDMDDSDSSEDESSRAKTPASTQELGRTPLQRHAFFFNHSLGADAPNLRDLHPLPSQIPFILDTFAECINIAMQVVHMPTVNKIAREMRTNPKSLTPSNEALLFAIYYATITSMEDEDVSIFSDATVLLCFIG